MCKIMLIRLFTLAIGMLLLISFFTPPALMEESSETSADAASAATPVAQPAPIQVNEFSFSYKSNSATTPVAPAALAALQALAGLTAPAIQPAPTPVVAPDTTSSATLEASTDEESTDND